METVMWRWHQMRMTHLRWAHSVITDDPDECVSPDATVGLYGCKEAFIEPGIDFVWR
jgi:hypothetical protein